MIRAVIFDMDGVLIDSEPLWRIAEVEVLASVGVPITYERTLETMGLRTDEVVEYWHQRYPWSDPPKKQVEAGIDRRVLELIQERGKPARGALAAIERCAAAGFPLAIASSSASELIAAVVDTLGVRDRFAVLQSAEHEPYGKPHPAVYIEAARALGIPPDQCLAIEDSPNGLLAAKAARMRCIVVPDPALRHDRRYCIADAVLDSLEDLSLDLIRSL
ncbi:MAG: 2-deoxyglucose-6-phosphatase [Thermomicrobiales bacterium]|nr:MAG: 2-deoxyglucose-6-phosphatase [Thermomicrobiales bacterium]